MDITKRIKKTLYFMLVFCMFMSFIHVNVNATEDTGTITGSRTIQTRSIEWLKIYGNHTLNGNEVTMTPENNSNGASKAVLQINFSVGGEGDLAAESIKIKIPKSVFKDRSGNMVGNVSVPLAKAPQKEGNTGFNYIEEGDEIIISNYKPIASSYFFTAQISYDVVPSYVSDGFSNNEIRAKFEIEDSNGGGKTVATSNALKLNYKTSINKPTARKFVQSKYENWVSVWGDKPKDADDYFYVVWNLETKVVGSTQPFIISQKEGSMSHGGEVIGFNNKGLTQKFTMGNKDDFDNWAKELYNGKNQSNTVTINSYVLSRYKKSEVEDKSKLSNTFETTVKGVDSYEYSVETTSNPYTYSKPNFTYGGDGFSSNKSTGVWSNETLGGVNAIVNDKNITQNYNISLTSRAYNLTYDEESKQYGVKSYDMEIEEGELYYNKNRHIADAKVNGKQLTKDDYRIIDFAVNEAYLQEAENNSEQGLTGKRVNNINDIDVYILKKDSSEYEKYGTINKNSIGQFTFTNMDGEEKVVGTNLISLPDNVYKMKFKTRSKSYYTAMNFKLRFEFYPTDNAKEYIKFNETSYIINEAKASVKKTDAKEGEYAYKANPSIYLRPTEITPEKSIYKNMSNKSDPIGAREVTTVTLHRYEHADFGKTLTKDDAINLSLIKEHKDATFYDLLPAGVSVDAASIKAAQSEGQSYIRNTAVLLKHTVEFIDNYKDSGRTLMKIHVTLPEGMQN